VIEKSDDAPRAYNIYKFTSRCSPEEWLAASTQPPINQFALRIETNPSIALLFHECKCKLAARSAQTFQCSHHRRNDICWQIHQETFGDPACALSRIEAAFDQRLFIESGDVQINCDKMQSFNADSRKGAQFMTLRRRMVDLPKSRTSKILNQFETERIKACADYDDLCSSIDQCGAYQSRDTFLSQDVMQQDSRDRYALDQLRDRSKPALSNNFQKQTRLP